MFPFLMAGSRNGLVRSGFSFESSPIYNRSMRLATLPMIRPQHWPPQHGIRVQEPMSWEDGNLIRGRVPQDWRSGATGRGQAKQAGIGGQFRASRSVPRRFDADQVPRDIRRTISLLGEIDSDRWSLNFSLSACELRDMPGLPPNHTVAGVSIRLARTEERLRRDRLMAERPELGSLRLVVLGLRYVAVPRTLWVGLAGRRADVPSARPVHRRKPSQPYERLHLVARNAHLLLLPEPGAGGLSLPHS